VIKKLILIFAVFFLLGGVGWGETYYYVDPDFGGTPDGSAATPWTLIDNEGAVNEWTAINSALASDSVTIYFSARNASADTDETATDSIEVLRTDGSANRLTLDGMSQYNTNDSTPSWSAYSGSSRFTVTASYPLDFFERDTETTVSDNITVQGFHFDTTGGFCAYIGGDNLIIQDNEFEATAPQVGPLVQFRYSDDVGVQTNLIFRRNTLHDTHGEALYIGGDGNNGNPSHTYIYIYENEIYDIGTLGGEGDGIDIKDEMRYVYVYNNYLYDIGNIGIVSHTWDDIYIYNNLIYSGGSHGIALNGSFGTGGDLAAIYGNIIYDHGTSDDSYAIALTATHDGDEVDDVRVYNNTINNNERGIAFSATTDGDFTNAVMRNNLVTNNDEVGVKAYNVTPTFFNNDVYNNTDNYQSIAEQGGSNGNITVDPLYDDAGSGDFNLDPSSPACFGGTAISGYNTRLDPTSSWPDDVRTRGDTRQMGAHVCNGGAAGM